MSKTKQKSGQYVFVNYEDKYTVIGTLKEISEYILEYEFSDSVITEEQYYFVNIDDIHSELYFWDYFEQKIFPKKDFDL